MGITAMTGDPTHIYLTFIPYLIRGINKTDGFKINIVHKFAYEHRFITNCVEFLGSFDIYMSKIL